MDDLEPLADCVRDLYTQLGARQYQINLVWLKWSAGSRGRGNAYPFKVETLLPTPRISTLTGVTLTLQSIGTTEDGGLMVDEISPRYDEDLLMGRIDGDIPKDTTFFWEVVFYRHGKVAGPRRRFTPQSAPNKDPLAFQWTIRLNKAQDDRLRDGQVR